MKLTARERATLREMFGGQCAYCGCELPVKGWHADHVEPIIREVKYESNPKTGIYEPRYTGKCWSPQNQRKDNFFPSCAPCNIDKSSMSIDSWRRGLQDHANVLRRNSSTFRHAERFGLVEVKEIPIVFWFEKFIAAQALTNQAIPQ